MHHQVEEVGGPRRAVRSVVRALCRVLALMAVAVGLGAAAPGAVAGDVRVEVSLDAGARLAESWPAGQQAGGSRALEPRAGLYAKTGVCVQGDPWSWGAAVAADGLQVPFEPAQAPWEPAAVGLDFPPEVRGRVEALWVEYGEPAPAPGCPMADDSPSAPDSRQRLRWSSWLGRRPLGLGGGTGLIGFATEPGLDQVGMSVRVGTAEYRKAVARLSPGERYLLAHQLTLGPYRGPWGSLRLLGYEIGVVSPRFASLPVTWVPLWPGYLTQHLALGGVKNDDANFYIGVAGILERASGPVRRLEAELLVDDMPQVPWKRQVYQLGGAVRAQLGEHWTVRYTRVTNFVITFQKPHLSLIHDGRLLAYPDGPDTDSLRVDWQPEGHLAWSLEWRRRGPGRVGEAWEWKQNDVEWGKAREFLGGTVEHAVLLGVTARLRDGAELAFQAGPVWNTASVEGARSALVSAALRIAR